MIMNDVGAGLVSARPGIAGQARNDGVGADDPVRPQEQKIIFTSTERGIKPLIDSVHLMRGAYLADKMLGKAAALICVHGGVLAVYANKMTLAAAEVFAEYGIIFEADEFIERVMNRDMTDLCPMERLGEQLHCPKQALCKVTMKLKEMGVGRDDPGALNDTDVPQNCGACCGSRCK